MFVDVVVFKVIGLFFSPIMSVFNQLCCVCILPPFCILHGIYALFLLWEGELMHTGFCLFKSTSMLANFTEQGYSL